MSDLAELKRRYEAELLSHIQHLEDVLQSRNNEYQDQKKLVQVYRDDAEKSKVRLEENCRKEAKLQFVSVLVDGDHMNFKDEFVQDEQKGGRFAARALIKAVQDHVQKVKPNISPNICYKIRVYANMAGLVNAYHDTSIVGSRGMKSFVQGFNMEDTLCDFVDAGSGKECSDVKIRALFEHSFLDVHCQHIIFCGSADNGYARILGPHRDSDRISLVEGPPFAHEMRQLAADFETTSFPQVFRSKKLSKQVSLGTPAATPTLTPPRTPIPNYASVARKTPLMSNESSSVSNLPTGASATSNIQLLVCQNAQGQRVDSPLEISTKGKLEVLKRHKFCNQFHILGSCFWGTSLLVQGAYNVMMRGVSMAMGVLVGVVRDWVAVFPMKLTPELSPQIEIVKPSR
ncbi:hypothetical protein N7475_008626 [Penicillium sp. IBT 31633x]|nr:hypothetical protein N7475_008626 [Penicillium sp. IBT 31633x]